MLQAASYRFDLVDFELLHSVGPFHYLSNEVVLVNAGTKLLIIKATSLNLCFLTARHLSEFINRNSESVDLLVHL